MSPYLAYERVAGSSVINGVEAHCRHLTTDGSFSPTSIPQLTDVEQTIDQAYYNIQAHLAKAGYDTAVAASATAVLGILERLNIYGAVMQIELQHPITGRSGEGNDRYIEYKKSWDEGISMLASDALEELGHTRTDRASSFVELGGRSISRKQVAYDDADAVQPRFKRGFGRDPAISIVNAGTPV